MAYGLISTTVLLSLGIPPATASASVHAAEVFTTGASGLSHWRFGNLDKRLFWKLAPAGMIGGGLGAYVLTATPGSLIRPIVGIYLGLMGAVVLWKAFQREERREPRRVRLIGFVGGFLDAVGGGGWGALVASSLVGQGAQARLAIGSTNAAEFLVTVTISATFVIDRPRTLADHCRFDRRRGSGCAVCGLRDPEIAGPGPDGPGGSRDHPPQHAGDDSPVSSRVAHIRRFGFPVRTHVIRAP